MEFTRARTSIASALLPLSVFIAVVQNSAPAFEVASIRPANSGRPGISIETEPEWFKAINATVSFFIQYAYAITGADGVSGDSFGSAVSIQDRTIAAGAFNHATAAGLGAGSAYLFHLSDDQWTQFAQVSGSDVASRGGFGGSIVFRNGTLLVGAPLQHPQPNNVQYPEGQAYIYNVN